VPQRLIGRGIGTGQGEVDGRAHLRGHQSGHRVRRVRVEHAGRDQPVAHSQQRVGAPGRLVLLRRAEHRDRLVLGKVQRHAGRGNDVAVRAEPVDLRLHQCRAVARAGTGDRRSHRAVHENRVPAVDRDAGHRERPGLDRQRFARRGVRVLLLHPGDHVVGVVLQHVDDRELPQRGDVQCFGEGALLGRAIAEEAQHHLLLLADLRRVGGAGRLRDALPDNARCAQEPAFGVGQVHRAAVPTAQAGGPPVDLGHHRVRIAAEDQGIAVTPVGGQDLVTGTRGSTQRGQRPDDRRLRPVSQVGVAADHARVLGERRLDPFLELPDPQHLPVHPDQAVGVRLRNHVIHRILSSRVKITSSSSTPRTCRCGRREAGRPS
jgi:hypothetical protein